MTDLAHESKAIEVETAGGEVARSTAARWRAVVATGAVAVLIFVTLDRLAARVVPPHRISEVTDGVHALRVGDPTVLALGSSHARTFEVVGRDLEQRTAGHERLVAVPVEYGKFTSYEWVLNHRLLPLVNERDAAGARRRPSLRRFILITEWWDSCAPVDGFAPPNVPARAWNAGDFGRDVASHGLTDYNRSYIAEQWRQLFSGSALMQDRGYGRLWDALRERLRPDPQAAAAKYALTVEGWQGMIERGDSCIADPVQMAAFSRILDSLQAHKIEVTLLLYPRKPATLTEHAKETTLAHWARIVQDTAAAHGARFIDFTSTSPLTDADFAADFDHVTPTGNAMFSRWALAGSFAFLLDRSGTTEAAR